MGLIMRRLAWITFGCLAFVTTGLLKANPDDQGSVRRYKGSDGDLLLILKVDFSSGRPVIVGGSADIELESGDIKRGTEDHRFEAKVFGDRYVVGRLADPDQGNPGRELEVVVEGEFVNHTLTLMEIAD